MDSVTQAQHDMRDAYYDGIPGIVTSGTTWLIAGLVAIFKSPMAGMLTLIFAGMLIFPISVMLCKALGRRGQHNKQNPLAPLAIEGTIWMLLSIPIAVAASLYQVELFFPAMLCVIAGRYLTFNTLYGNRMYYFFSIFLAGCGMSLAVMASPVYLGALLGGAVEIAFATAIYVQVQRDDAIA
ncbi:DUF7010 family protein [Echinimonas agarilytica]|uniref:Uncharacterized protein n=1 Tax=Echinimonas agarilytica TaxID=1215918 RepID=A0AA42B7J6_9GAMM|nr:hypothetical protein [Echinimonas agarilytica]MCM2680200.1 hypothetical protein [Echinimonas agarilytica]